MKDTIQTSASKFSATRGLRVFSLSALALTASLATPGRAQDLSDAVKAQIADVLSVKNTFTPAERKMDSRLVFAQRAALGQNIGTAAASIIKAGPTDSINVTVRSIGKANKAFRNLVTQHGGTVNSFKNGAGYVDAAVPVTSLTDLAAEAGVLSIRVTPHPLNNVGGLTSQGYVVEKSKAAGKQLGITGAGVTVGVLSDSASQARVNALIASGDLGPNSKVIVPFAGTDANGNPTDAATDEGAAMMEIVQDMAPGATVLFATAYNTPTQFANDIIALQQAGASIIVDDVGYSGEGPFQDDVISRGVNTVTDSGVLYFSSAGNSGSVAHGTSGTWEGDFVNGGAYTPPAGSGSTSTYNVAQIGANNYDAVKLVGEPYIDMEWSDPLGTSTNDYDFFVTDSTGATLKGFSVTVQNGSQDPVEELDSTAIGGNYASPAAGDRLVITQTTGAANRFLRIDTNRGQLATFTNGSTAGHSAAASTFGVAATFWNSSKTGAKAVKTGNTYPAETFSSDGPRHIFYFSDGTPITAGNFSSTGGSVLQKPDATAVDGVNTETPGFSPFFGTSAAAPHAAGVGALVKSVNPALTNRQIRNILTSTAVDNEATGVDVTGGAGVLDALAACMTAAATTPTGQ